MAYTKQTWTDHVVERPRTYREATNSDGTKTLTPEFGTVTQQGTPVNAAHLNHMEDGIETAQNGVDTLNAWKETLDIEATTQAAQQAIEDANDAIEAIEAVAGSIPQDYSSLSETVAEHSTDIEALKLYGNQIYTGGANGSMTEKGITVSNTGRLYTVNGTGTEKGSTVGATTGCVNISVLDGSTAWENRANTLPLKAGHTYRFSIQASQYPTNSSDNSKYYDGAYALIVRDSAAAAAQSLFMLRPGKAALNGASTDGSFAYYYCRANMNVYVQLSILVGSTSLNQFFTFNSFGILIGIADASNEETLPIQNIGSSPAAPPIPSLFVDTIKFPNGESITGNIAEQVNDIVTGHLPFYIMLGDDSGAYLTGNQLKVITQSLKSNGQLQAGTGSATGTNAAATGSDTTASGNYSHAEGVHTNASGIASHAEGGGMTGASTVEYNTASGDYSHVEGVLNNATAYAAHAEGMRTTASGSNAHAEGANTVASNYAAHAEGAYTVASGSTSHAEGKGTIANHEAQHAFGRYNVADTSEESSSQAGDYVEIVGNGTSDNARSNARTLDWDGNEELAGDLVIKKGTADEINVRTAINNLEAHFPDDNLAVGGSVDATGGYSAAIGTFDRSGSGGVQPVIRTVAAGNASFAAGAGAVANGDTSQAFGRGTVADQASQQVFGKFNVADTDGTYVEIVGNGTEHFSRSNARTLDWSGNETLAGDLTINKGSANEKTIGEALNEHRMGEYRIVRENITVSYPQITYGGNRLSIAWGSTGKYKLIDKTGTVIDEFTKLSTALPPYAIGNDLIGCVYWDPAATAQAKIKILPVASSDYKTRFYPLGWIDCSDISDPHNWIGIKYTVAT